MPEEVQAPANLHNDVDEQAANNFLKEVGVSEAALVGIAIAVTILGLLCFCVGCPIVASMRSLKARCLNDPDRLDRENVEKLNRILAKRHEVAALERMVEEKSVVYDDWGSPQNVNSKQHRNLEQNLEYHRKKLHHDEQLVSGRQVKEARARAERRRRREEHRARLCKMREAYASRTIAVDGVALRAPPAVLVDLGFDASMIEVFGMPGFSSFGAEHHVETDDLQLDLGEGTEERQQSDPHKTDYPENEEEAGEEEETGSEDEQGSDGRANQLVAPSVNGSTVDDGTLKMPPLLEEITAAVMKEGFEQRTRRGAIADSKEGKPMDPVELQRAMKIAASLSVKGDVIGNSSLTVPEDFDDDTYNERDHGGDEECQLDSLTDRYTHAFETPEASDVEEEDQTGIMVCRQARSVRGPDVAPKCNTAIKTRVGKELRSVDDFGNRPSNVKAHLPRREQVDDVSELAADTGGAKKDHQLSRYSTQIYGGMAVRPRGFGTPRSLMLDVEVYRSSLAAPKMSRHASQH
eukprot:TRINITY_DN104709_c0_g1_i1.p1 TRINITY_DN104709_c0_g1~~TRINITY_DN104709_c0_g1_i1.p1  ORF type:complete len:521 (+),score=95.45 TRINITY_DN104709_c0_g1_i1:67-1629(+)